VNAVPAPQAGERPTPGYGAVVAGLFANRAFSAALATNTLGFFVTFGALLFIVQYLQLVLGLSPLRAGLWTVPSGGGVILGSMLTPLLVRHIRPAFVMAGGLTLAAVGVGLLTQVDAASGLAVLVTGSVVFSVGLAPVFTVAADLAIGAAPPARAGAASAISETSSEFGGALGIAILGSVATAIYRGQVTDAVPAGVQPRPQRPRGIPSAASWQWSGSSPADSAPSCWMPPARRSPRGCS